MHRNCQMQSDAILVLLSRGQAASNSSCSLPAGCAWCCPCSSKSAATHRSLFIRRSMATAQQRAVANQAFHLFPQLVAAVVPCGLLSNGMSLAPPIYGYDPRNLLQYCSSQLLLLHRSRRL